MSAGQFVFFLGVACLRQGGQYAFVLLGILFTSQVFFHVVSVQVRKVHDCHDCAEYWQDKVWLNS